VCHSYSGLESTFTVDSDNYSGQDSYSGLGQDSYSGLDSYSGQGTVIQCVTVTVGSTFTVELVQQFDVSGWVISMNCAFASAS
jgi:hypothetical protein